MSMEMLVQSEVYTVVKLHPVVIFQILDRYVRRNDGQERVIGTLFGRLENTSSTSRVLTITQCFPVPHLEQGEIVAVDTEYHANMSKLYSKMSNGQESIVGWYSTALGQQQQGEEETSISSSSESVSINEHSCIIHEFYAKECKNPIHLVVDTLLSNARMSVNAFVSSALEVTDCALANQFKQIQVETITTKAEDIALECMLKTHTQSSKDNGVNNDDTSSQRQLTSTLTELQTLEGTIKRLYAMIETSSDYVDRVLEGKIESDASVGRDFAKAIMSIPELSPDVFDHIFNSSLQDLLMVNYLSSLTHAQISISEQLLNSI